MTPRPPLLEAPGRFEAISLIHEGKGRDLWLLRDLRDGRVEVLKRCNEPGDEAGRKAIADEYLLLERLRHPHWVRATAFDYLADGTCGYRMPFLSGESPRDLHSPGFAPSDPEAIRAILGALATLHAINFVHLDLKPSQVVTGSGGAVLIDPGLAAAEGSPIVARGTWGFIAPEVLAGRAWDRRADLYGLGCALVQIWTGEKPLGEGEIAEQARRKAGRLSRNLRERVPGMPEGVDRWIDSLLTPVPEGRPRDAFAAWRALHALAGYRSDYAQKSRLPAPFDLPFMPDKGLEERWRRSLRGDGPQRWCIEGAWGSGRRRLIHRLRALAEVEGVLTGFGEGRIVAGAVVCRVGTGVSGEETIGLGSIGSEGAGAALDAYGLAPEGGEEHWLPALLAARIAERIGGETERRSSARMRRSLAAASTERLSAGSIERLASALGAVEENERPFALPRDPLVAEGFARVGTQGRLEPSIPPWDQESLQILVGPSALRRAHAGFLSRAVAQGTENRTVAIARHAIGSESPEQTAASIPEAIYRLRHEGRQGLALDLLEEAERIAGGSLPERWRTWRAVLAIEEGSPARCLALLRRGSAALPDGWRQAIEAHLASRSGRNREALELLAPLLTEDVDEGLRLAAQMVHLRALLQLRKWEEVECVGRSLLERTASNGEDAPARRSGPAQILLSAMRIQGRTGIEVDRLRDLCEKELERVGLREKLGLASVLGADAFQRADLERARRFFEISAETARAAGDEGNLISAQVNLGGVLFEEGRLSESESVNRSAVATAERIRDSIRTAGGYRNLAAVLLYAGRLGEALEASREARAGYEALDETAESIDSVALEITILTELGLKENAAAAAALLESPERRAMLSPVASAILLRDRARLAREGGRFDEARRLLGASLDAARACGALDEVVRTGLELQAMEITLTGSAAQPPEDPGSGLATPSADIVVRRLFVEAQADVATASDRGVAAAAIDRLARAAIRAEEAKLRSWIWRCHAAEAGLRRRVGDGGGALQSLRSASAALNDLLESIGTEALRESFILRPDPRSFLAWCEGDPSLVSDLPPGSSDMEVFLR